MRDVYVIGVGMTPFGKHMDKNMKTLAADATNRALEHAGITKDKLQVAVVGNAYQGLVTGQESIRGQVVLRAMGIGGIPVTNVENACCSSATALQVAWMDIALGLHDVALVLGMEKMYMDDREKRLKLFSASADVEVIEMLVQAMKADAERKRKEAEARGETKKEKESKGGSAFMEIYAMGARLHMDKYGLTQRQLAVVSSKNHNHSVNNPYAQYRKPFTVEEVLAAQPIAYPLTLPMCAPVGDGAAAAILCSKKMIKKLGASKPVKILSTVVGGGMDRGFDDPDIGERVAKVAYEAAGVGPEDIDVAEFHDATAFGEVVNTEALGFCPRGEGGIFAEQGHSTLGGKLPINPSGGLESKGHPVGATGAGQIAELVWQLRGEADGRQVEGARIALAENGGGNIGIEEAAMVITILQADF
ncbi:thiolase family protein [Desulfosudis oleivorans]|uniref:Propanoyl-CoA C-acyltransferase n=1 Tax=Desulfosudis oleivorans (strain DSM 6200 / JCM 39069 / Hxd3) TaxID=96561 RepID=A8ZZC3_DESOH|nr:thiolase family protein [Desulfosudis oleivorans]ABW67276.1 Propanoyl-CoA C-acyltransferase [Desulfosudis oleivorans Hxd3]